MSKQSSSLIDMERDSDSTPSSSSYSNDETSQGATSFVSRIISGSVGAIITSFAVTPLEVLKVRQQQVSSVVESSSSQAVSIHRCRSCGTFVFHNGLMDCVVNKKSVPHFNPPANSGIVAKKAVKSNSYMNAARMSQSLLGNNPFISIRNLYKTEGFVGIYAGLGPTLVMSVPNTVMYFTAYDEISSRLNDILHAANWRSIEWAVPLVSGSSARLFASIVTSPLELVRTRQAMSNVGNLRHENGSVGVSTSSSNSRNFLQELRYIVRSEGGIFSLWNGLGPTLWRDVPFSAIYWLGVEQIRGSLDERWHRSYGNEQQIPAMTTAYHSFVSGALAGMIAAGFTTPFDVIKTRNQAIFHDVSSKKSQISTIKCDHNGAAALAASEIEALTRANSFQQIAHICKNEGLQALWRGNVTRMLKVAPACAIMISCYESGKRFAMEL